MPNVSFIDKGRALKAANNGYTREIYKSNCYIFMERIG